MAFLASKNVSAKRTTAPSKPMGNTSPAKQEPPSWLQNAWDVFGWGSQAQAAAAAGNGPLCSAGLRQAGPWCLVFPPEPWSAMALMGGQCYRGNLGLCIMLVSTFSPLLLHKIRNFVVKLSRFGSVPATSGTRN